MSEPLNTVEEVGFDHRIFESELNVSGLTTHSASGFTFLGVNSRNGFQNPYWKSQCRAGVNATTTFSGTRWDGDLERSFWTFGGQVLIYSNTGRFVSRAIYDGGAFLQYSSFPTIPGPPTNVITDVHNRCVRRFIDEVNSAQSSENLTGRSIKHFKHDVHSLIHPMSGIQAKISSYLTSLQKVGYGKLKGASLYNTLTAAYLEFKFGVEPFANDIADIVSDMVIRDRKRNPSEPVKGSAHALYTGSVTVGVGISDSSLFSFLPTYDIQNTSVYSERIKGAVRTGINDEGRLGVIQDNRLLPKDWAPTIFSILPYAWMVNYFTNIRDIIDAASLRYSDLVWGCHTIKATNTISYTDVKIKPHQQDGSFPNVTYNTIESQGGNATFSVSHVTRTAISPASLVPSFAWTMPTTATPWANMMAAFSGRILKVVSSFL